MVYEDGEDEKEVPSQRRAFPFGGEVSVPAIAGRVVIFPAWLLHYVEPTKGAGLGDGRIALSFNLPGDWEATGVRLTNSLEQQKDQQQEGGGGA